MDKRSLRLLEFDKLRELLASFAGSSRGKSQALKLKALRNAEEIRTAQAETSQMRNLLDENIELPLGGLFDISAEISRARIGSMLNPEDLLKISQTLRCAGRMHTFLKKLDHAYELLRNKARDIADLGRLLNAIEDCVDENATIRDTASPLLAQIRQQLRTTRNAMRERIQQLVASESINTYLQSSQPGVSGNRFVLAVQAPHKNKIAGVIHRTSDSGQTVYIEPMQLVRMGNKLAEKTEAENHEEKRILREITALVGEQADRIVATIDLLTELDLLNAKGKLSKSLSMTEPEICSGRQLRLKAARHPLLEWIIRNRKDHHKDEPEKIVPVDIHLGDTFDLLVVTGPNTGGKTVALKTLGLLCLMAQSGMHVPARRAVLPRFRSIFADIGDEQSLQQNLSTFSSHLKRIAFILRRADKHSLVLLDELGAGTDPAEGAALGQAMLDELRRKRARAVVTTHLGALKLYAYRVHEAQNACVEFDVKTLRPTFRLCIGEAGESNAIVIARRLGLSKRIVKRARGLVKRHSKLDDVIDEIEHSRRQAERQREEAELAQAQAEDAKAEFEIAREELNEKARKHLPPEALLDFQVGDEVYVERFHKMGKLLNINARKQKVTVEVGQVKAQLSLDEIHKEKPE